MNKLTLENTRDFPITTNTLKFMQDAYALLEKLAAIGGDNYIVSGCVITGSSVSAGYMVLKGQLMPFKAGTVTTNVKITEDKQTITVEGGSREETSYQAEFGTSSNPDNNVAWASIKRINNIIELMANISQLSNNISGNTSAISLLDGRINDLELVNNWAYAELLSGASYLSSNYCVFKRRGNLIEYQIKFRFNTANPSSHPVYKIPSWAVPSSGVEGSDIIFLDVAMLDRTVDGNIYDRKRLSAVKNNSTYGNCIFVEFTTISGYSNSTSGNFYCQGTYLL